MSKIMLVEDDNNLREIYEARLLAEGYEVISAKDGEEALALAQKERPDLVISDVMMPKISGFDMLDILRTTPGIENTKVVMMTALSQAEDKERADKLGADKYLVKSQVTLEDVARVAEELLNGGGTPDATPSTESQASTETDSSATTTTTADMPVVEPNQPTSSPEEANTPANTQANEPAAQTPATDTSSETTNDQTTTTQANPVQANDDTDAKQQSTTPAPTTDQATDTQTTSTNNDTTVSSQNDAPQPTAPANAPVEATENNNNSTPTTPESAESSPPPAPAPTMPQVSADTPQSTQPATADSTNNQQSSPDNSSPVVTPDNSMEVQTTAEEEAAIDSKIDDFVKNQLHSEEPPVEEKTPAQQPTPKVPDNSPEDQLNQGNGFSLPSSEPTQNIAVKDPPKDAGNNTDTNQQAPLQPTQEPTPQATTPAPEQAAQVTQPQPTSTPPPAPQLANKTVEQQPEAPNAATGGQRVIQPINDVSQDSGENLKKLADEEEAENQQATNLPASSVISPNGETVTPATPNGEPNSTQPGNVIQPGGSQASEDDPNNIAL